jgi:hypothetical protein
MHALSCVDACNHLKLKTQSLVRECQRQQLTIYLPWPPWTAQHKIEMILSVSPHPRRKRQVNSSPLSPTFLPVECLFIEAPFHRSGFSSNNLFIECTISCNFQNCKQNFCSASTSKVIDDLVRVTI